MDYARAISRRALITLIAVVAALAAAAIAAAVAFVGRPPSESAGREGRPPLALDATLTGDEHAAALSEGERLYAADMVSSALAVFDEILQQDPDSVGAAVGEAIARWPAGTTARLRTLASTNPESGLARLHLGFALFWERRDDAALRAWREVLVLEPDEPWALRAENLLHPDMPRGRPIFVPSKELPEALLGQPLEVQLRELESRARADGRAQDWIAYGVALQRAGRPVSAREAFERAAAVSPDDPEARTAVAIGHFEKDDPAAAFSLLGPLTAEFPGEPVVKYHLGLALLWIGGVADARTQLEEARASRGAGFYPEQAQRLLDELDRAAEAGE